MVRRVNGNTSNFYGGLHIKRSIYFRIYLFPVSRTLRTHSDRCQWARMLECRALAIHSNANRCEFKTISRNVSRLTIKQLRQYVIWQSGKFNSLMSIPITAKLFFQSARSSLNHLSRIYRICAICLMSIECSEQMALLESIVIDTIARLDAVLPEMFMNLPFSNSFNPLNWRYLSGIPLLTCLGPTSLLLSEFLFLILF